MISVDSETKAETTTQVTVADAPFDDPDTDLIIRTSDQVDFRVHRLILSLNSPFFKKMMALPQPSGGYSHGDTPIVEVTESSTVIKPLLECCYPNLVDQGQTSEVQHAMEVLEASLKYEIGGVEKFLKPQLRHFMKEEPLRYFAVACRNRWRDEAKLAAQLLLEQRLPFNFVKEMEQMPVGVFHQLISYHIKCGIAASQAITMYKIASRVRDPDPIASYSFFHCNNSKGCPAAHKDEEIAKDSGRDATSMMYNYRLQTTVASMRLWFQTFLIACQNALKERPYKGAILSPVDLVSLHTSRLASCTNCQPHAQAQVSVFVGKHLYPMVENAIAKVDFDLQL